MTDVEAFYPRLSNCPHCGKELTGEQYVDVMDTDPFDAPVGTAETATMEMPAVETTRCIRFLPCGHAFEEDSIDDITDALRKLRQLRSKRRKCEDAERLREYDYEIEAQVHAVNNRASDAVRREKADEEMQS